MGCHHRLWAITPNRRAYGTAFVVAIPSPRIPKPERWEQVDGSSLIPVVGDPNADEQIVRGMLRIFALHVKVVAIFENAGVQNLVFQFLAASTLILS